MTHIPQRHPAARVRARRTARTDVVRRPRAEQVLLAASALGALLAAPLRADDGGAEEPPYDVEQEEVRSEDPPFRLERPNDSWVFIDLEAMEERERAAGRDTSGYETLQARLWWGAAQANVYVHAYPYGVNRREPPTAEELGSGQLEQVRRSLADASVERKGAGRVGRRRAFLFEVTGARRGSGEDVVILRAVVYRREDNQVFVLSLECPQGERADDCREDFSDLLGEARL